MFSCITITITSSVFYLFLCFLVVRLFYFLLRPEPSFVFLSGEKKRKLRLNHVKPLRFPNPELQSSCPSCFVFAHFFSQCEHSFIDNPMTITEPAVPCARLLSLGSKPYPSSEQDLSIVLEKLKRAYYAPSIAQSLWKFYAGIVVLCLLPKS